MNKATYGGQIIYIMLKYRQHRTIWCEDYYTEQCSYTLPYDICHNITSH